MTRHDDESLLELTRWTLGAVAGCAAPLWCWLVGHRPIDWPLSPPNVGEICERCGNELEGG